MRYIKNNSPNNHPLIRTKNSLLNYWKQEPSVLIFPGEEFTYRAQEDALDFGWNMISSYYQAIKCDGRFCWTQQICSPYLDEIDTKWLDSEVPFIGYFHDFDLSRNGISWFSDCVNNWKKLGIENFIDLRTLLIGLNCTISTEENNGRVILNVDNELSSKSGYPFKIKLRVSRKPLTKEIIINNCGESIDFKVENTKSNKEELTVPGINQLIII